MHLISFENEAARENFTTLEAFKAFQVGLKQHRVAPSSVADLQMIGYYSGMESEAQL